MSTLTVLRRSFPHLKKVKDAKTNVTINVEKQDCKNARKKDASHCALARACVRQNKADAAVIGIATSYLIKGNTAYRFKTGPSIAREVTSFDRHQDFATGKYTLARPSKAATFEAMAKYNAKNKAKRKKWNGRTTLRRNNKVSAVHRTTNVRNLFKQIA